MYGPTRIARDHGEAYHGRGLAQSNPLRLGRCALANVAGFQPAPGRLGQGPFRANFLHALELLGALAEDGGTIRRGLMYSLLDT